MPKPWPRLLVAAAIVATVVVGLRSHLREAGLPRHEGRSAREWFEICQRNRARMREGGGSLMTTYQCQEAFLAMGTNALTFLVPHALALPEDSEVRKNLHLLFRTFPVWAGRDLFAPREEANETAADLLRGLRPSLPSLLPLIESRLQGTNEYLKRPAIFLLGTVGEGAEAAALRIGNEFKTWTDPVLQIMAVIALERLGAPASNALPGILAHPNRNLYKVGLIPLAARIGPAAGAMVPLLEDSLTSTNAKARMDATVALLSVDPDHARALQAAAETVHESLNNVPGQSNDDEAPVTLLCRAVNRLLQRPHERLGEILEPLALRELRRTDAQRPDPAPIAALAHASPERARKVLRGIMQSAEAGPATVFAAGTLLRLERGNQEVATFLASAIERNAWWNATALQLLGEAASTNRVATEALARYASDTHPFPLKGAAAEIHARSLRGIAITGRERIRIREALAARGLPENPW